MMSAVGFVEADAAQQIADLIFARRSSAEDKTVTSATGPH
jgi:hypothetical protein